MEGKAIPETMCPKGAWSAVERLLRQRTVWGLTLGPACAGYALRMSLTWLPGYIQTSMDKSILQSGLYAATQVLVRFISGLSTDGWWVDRVIRPARSANLLIGVAVIIDTGVIVDITGGVKYAIVIGGIALAGGLLRYLLLRREIEPIPVKALEEAPLDYIRTH